MRGLVWVEKALSTTRPDHVHDLSMIISCLCLCLCPGMSMWMSMVYGHLLYVCMGIMGNMPRFTNQRTAMADMCRQEWT